MADIAPQPEGEVKTHRRRHRSAWIPAKPVLVVAALCAVFFAYFVSRQGYHTDTVELKDVPSPFQAGLSVDEPHFEGSGTERQIVGLVRNSGSTAASGVTLLLRFRDADGNFMGESKVHIPMISAGGTASFRTDPVPPGTTAWTVRALQATSR